MRGDLFFAPCIYYTKIRYSSPCVLIISLSHAEVPENVALPHRVAPTLVLPEGIILLNLPGKVARQLPFADRLVIITVLILVPELVPPQYLLNLLTVLIQLVLTVPVPIIPAGLAIPDIRSPVALACKCVPPPTVAVVIV